MILTLSTIENGLFDVQHGFTMAVMVSWQRLREMDN